MKKIHFLLFAICPLMAFSQTKEIAFAELTPGSGMFFGAVMTTTDITVTVQGPSDRFLAFGQHQLESGVARVVLCLRLEALHPH